MDVRMQEAGRECLPKQGRVSSSIAIQSTCAALPEEAILRSCLRVRHSSHIPSVNLVDEL